MPACRCDVAVLRQASCAPVHVLLRLHARRCRHTMLQLKWNADEERELACTLRIHMQSAHARLLHKLCLQATCCHLHT